MKIKLSRVIRPSDTKACVGTWACDFSKAGLTAHTPVVKDMGMAGL